MKAIVTVVACAVCLAAASRSVWDGVYTKEQASRGKIVYGDECAKCHGENLVGSDTAPALAGKEFFTSWSGRSAGDMLQIVGKTMPSEDPGTLSSEQYADAIAYIFSVNEFPAGKKDLDNKPAAIKDIRIEEKKLSQ